MKRDELNILADKYYSVMDISDEDKKKRKKTAWELFDLFMLFFSWFKEAEDKGVDSTTYFLLKLEDELQNVVADETDIDEYFITYFAVVAYGIYSVTTEHKNEKYYLSEDRAANLALNESLSIHNHIDLRTAKKVGYNYKIWCTEQDEKVRPTHVVMEGVKKPIDDLFEVGDSFMEMPHDMTHGASMSEVSNCRCWLEFTKE